MDKIWYAVVFTTGSHATALAISKHDAEVNAINAAKRWCARWPQIGNGWVEVRRNPGSLVVWREPLN